MLGELEHDAGTVGPGEREAAAWSSSSVRSPTDSASANQLSSGSEPANRETASYPTTLALARSTMGWKTMSGPGRSRTSRMRLA